MKISKILVLAGVLSFGLSITRGVYAETVVQGPIIPSDRHDSTVWPYTQTNSCAIGGATILITQYGRIFPEEKKFEVSKVTTMGPEVIRYAHAKGTLEKADFYHSYVQLKNGWMLYDLLNDDDSDKNGMVNSYALLKIRITNGDYRRTCRTALVDAGEFLYKLQDLASQQ